MSDVLTAVRARLREHFAAAGVTGESFAWIRGEDWARLEHEVAEVSVSRSGSLAWGEDTEALGNDPLLSSLSEEERSTLIAQRLEDGSLRFDVHLQGEHETVFLSYPGLE